MKKLSINWNYVVYAGVAGSLLAASVVNGKYGPEPKSHNASKMEDVDIVTPVMASMQP